MIECADGSLYTGFATDIRKRLREHYWRLPRCARYTRSHPMTGLRGLWETEGRSTALRLEYRIKHLDRKSKDRLLEAPEEARQLLDAADIIRWVDETDQASIMEEVRGYSRHRPE